MTVKKTIGMLAAGMGVLIASWVYAGDMKPGLWEITSKNKMEGMAMPSMPAIPPDQLAKMKAMGIQVPAMGDDGQTTTFRHCITREEAEKGTPPAQQSDGKTQCVQKEVKRVGNKVSWKMECTGEHPATGTGTAVFEGPESYSGTTTIATRDPQHGPVTMNSTFSGKWISDSCN